MKREMTVMKHMRAKENNRDDFRDQCIADINITLARILDVLEEDGNESLFGILPNESENKQREGKQKQ